MAATKTRRTGRAATAAKGAGKAAPRRRRVTAGDTGPTSGAAAVERSAVGENIASATEAESNALQDILAGRSPVDAQELARALLRKQRKRAREAAAETEDELNADWRNGGYPYKNLLPRKSYERQKYRLQVELLKLQAWVRDRAEGHRAVRGPRRRRQGRHDQALHGAPEPARRARRGAGEAHRRGARPVVLPALRRSTCPRAARSCCSTAPGTTAPASSA